MITLRHVQQKNASFEAIYDSSQLLVKTDKGHTPLLTNVEAAKATRNTKATPKIKGRKPSAQLEPTCEASWQPWHWALFAAAMPLMRHFPAVRTGLLPC